MDRCSRLLFSWLMSLGSFGGEMVDFDSFGGDSGKGMVFTAAPPHKVRTFRRIHKWLLKRNMNSSFHEVM
jgi:hypothetical protein